MKTKLALIIVLIALGGCYEKRCSSNRNGGTETTTQTIPAPGAIILGLIGVPLAGWIKRKRLL